MRNVTYAFTGLGLALWSGCVYYAAAIGRPAPPAGAAPAPAGFGVRRAQAVWSGDSTRLYSAAPAHYVGSSAAPSHTQEVTHD